MSGGRILVVDDEVPILQLLKTQLAMFGFEVHAAQNGRAALDLLERQPVDGVILDLRMPQMDGFAVADEIQVTRGSLIPLVVVSGDDAGLERARSSSRFVACFRKPWDIEILARTLSDAVQNGKTGH